MVMYYFVTGANRGIGLELVKLISSNPENFVFAATRKPESLENLALPNVHVVKLESTSTEDALNAAKTVEEIAGGLDVVIANAGIGNHWVDTLKTERDAITKHFEVNVVGPVILFQALYPLLLKRQTRKFIAMSTLAASITILPNIPMPLSTYGSSKAALNFLTRSIHKEHIKDGFIVFPIHPGIVDTEMGQDASPFFSEGTKFITTQESAEALVKFIDKATTEESGRFWSYDGTELPW